MKNVFQTKASTIKIQISAPDAYYNSKFFLQALAGCGRLKEVGAFLIFQKWRNEIIFHMEFYGANKLLSQ